MVYNFVTISDNEKHFRGYNIEFYNTREQLIEFAITGKLILERIYVHDSVHDFHTHRIYRQCTT